MLKSTPGGRCLTACKALCDALDNNSEELFGTDDECLREIIREAAAKFGARSLYAAFLHSYGNVEARDLHLQIHRFTIERVMREIDDISKFH
ncbi:hypothetical protein [Calothrix sp. CCY 0018]|uniref:hypothetical protein n=1 Tax=Calothrix sp. CCY 0018 TaxID=3103864 RepID=UPI0039C65805